MSGAESNQFPVPGSWLLALGGTERRGVYPKQNSRSCRFLPVGGTVLWYPQQVSVPGTPSRGGWARVWGKWRRPDLLAQGSRTSGRLRSSGPCSWREARDSSASGLGVPRWALAAARDKTGTNPRSSLTPTIPALKTQPRGNFDVHSRDKGSEDGQGPKINIHHSRSTLIV